MALAPSPFACARYTFVGFVLLTLASITLYPGGTYRDRDSVGYLFFSNFLSDLGMPRSWGGHANPWGALLFVSAEVLLAIGVIAFFVGVVRLSSSVRPAKIWGRLAALAGITVALALVAAGLTPANRFPSLHVAAALTAFRGAAVAAAFLVLATAQDRRFPRVAVAVAVLIAVVLAGYVAVVEWGPRINNSDGLRFQATAQKIMCVVFIAGVAYLSLVAERLRHDGRESRH
jgi:hypothetical protein